MWIIIGLNGICTFCPLCPAAVQVKELTFSSDIASHDLSTKLKQVQSWLEKKNHVRITLRVRRTASTVALVSIVIRNHWAGSQRKIRQINVTWSKKNYLYYPVLNAQDQTLEDMVQQMPVTVGFVAKPKVIRDGRAMCILRPPSAKELAPQKEKRKPPPPTDATPQCSEPGTPPVSPAGPADASKEPTQQ